MAAPDPIIGINETALKQLVVMFNRIAIGGLFVDFSRVPSVSPELTKRRTWLAELGILFDLDLPKLKRSTPAFEKMRALFLEDSNSYTKSVFGMSSEEMVAARNDPEKMAQIRERGAEAKTKLADGTLDPLKTLELSLRMSTNGIRMCACQLREIENVEAYAVISYEFCALEQDDPRIKQHDVAKIFLGALPVPVDDTPWEQIVEYRNDPETKGSFLLIKECLSELVRGSFTLFQIEETLEYLLNQFRRNLETHSINTTTMGLLTYVVTNPEFLEMLASAGPDFGTRAMFSVEHHRIGLLEGESTSAGSVVAYLMQMYSEA
ncbi:MAG TPA: hypothetical protein VGD61_05590 [Pyrinomonadaceae bacterium]